MKFFSFFTRIKNLNYALRGIFFFIQREPNAKLYLIATILFVLAARYYHLTLHENIALIFASSLVWMAEAMNTAIELLGDEISLEQRERIGRAKDVAAGGVLLAAIGAVMIGVIIFAPHILS